MRRNYSELRLRPEQFAEYLLSPEVGFVSSEQIAVPQHATRGTAFCALQFPLYPFLL